MYVHNNKKMWIRNLAYMWVISISEECVSLILSRLSLSLHDSSLRQPVFSIFEFHLIRESRDIMHLREVVPTVLLLFHDISYTSYNTEQLAYSQKKLSYLH